MISEPMQNTLRLALEDARRRRHEYLCAEHVLYALTEDPDGRDILLNVGVDIDKLRADLDEYLSKHIEKAPEKHELTVHQTVAFERMMNRALAHVHYSSKNEVEAGDILVALMDEQNSFAKYALEEQGVARLDVLNYISHGVSKFDSDEDGDADAEDETDESQPGGGRPDPLEQFTENLTERAAEGKIDPLI
ncbi:MAG TPA: Clp protease N-terminal domain-containing protein, partial [candidate division Zixibacteria bacterium]|nr:Clp protease N-terminal domain-containing protein [candidate division Zixibacteria bacterium]